MKSDRRLCVAAGGDRIVEETDPDAAYLLVARGREISAADVKRFGLTVSDGAIVLPDAEPAPANEMSTPREDRPAPANDGGGAPAWPLSTSPADYLEKYGNEAKNSALAREILGLDEP